MKRLMAIDLGRKRCGVAVTDPLQIVATALDTIESGRLADYVVNYINANPVEAVIVGKPLTLMGQPSDSTPFIEPILNRLKKVLPSDIPIIEYDERFTSALAHQAMIDSGTKKKARQEKGAADRVAATIILNDYLNSRR